MDVDGRQRVGCAAVPLGPRPRLRDADDFVGTPAHRSQVFRRVARTFRVGLRGDAALRAVPAQSRVRLRRHAAGVALEFRAARPLCAVRGAGRRGVVDLAAGAGAHDHIEFHRVHRSGRANTRGAATRRGPLLPLRSHLERQSARSESRRECALDSRSATASCGRRSRFAASPLSVRRFAAVGSRSLRSRFRSRAVRLAAEFA